MSDITSSKKTSTVLEAIALALAIHVVILAMIYFSDIGMFSFSSETSKTKDIEVEFMEITEELLALQETPDQPDISELLDKYKNVTAKEGTSQTDVVRSYSFDKETLDEQIKNDLLQMEKDEFEKLKKPLDPTSDSQPTDDPDPKNQTQEKTKPNTSDGGSSSYSKSSTSYDFSRNAERTRKPSYKCRQFGQIIVEISVNRDGDVTSTKAISGNVDKNCLLEESLAYAQRWKFTAKHDAPKSEKGTITFTFFPE